MVSPVIPGGAQPVATPGQPGATEQPGTAEQRPSENAPQPATAALAENQTSEQDPRARDRDEADKAARNRRLAAGEDDDTRENIRAEDENQPPAFDPNAPRGSVVDLSV